MMKRITLLRHAKSSWDNPSIDDFDRPLNNRGEKDAPVMGQRLLARNVRPSLILSSRANRAITTARVIAGAIGYPLEFIQTERELYLASPDTILDIVVGNGERFNDVMIAGHNPGLTELANMISDARIDNIPTCGVFAVDANISDWSELRKKPGKLAWFDYPKKKPDESDAH
jgi:phosphohistidine phosphatase